MSLPGPLIQALHTAHLDGYRDAYPGGVFWLNAAGEWLPAFAERGRFLDVEMDGRALDRQARAVAKYVAAYRDELLARGALAVVDEPHGKVRETDLGTRHAAAVEATLAEQWDSLQSDDARLLLRVIRTQ